MTKKDTIYSTRKKPLGPFEFNREVAESFDDMAVRSIPGYREMQSIISRVTLSIYIEGSVIYDLGCSTGTTLLEIADVYKANERKIPRMVAVDSSPEMIRLARDKCAGMPVEFICDSIEHIAIDSASLVIASYTLQFTPVNGRKKIIKNIHDGLADNGMFILSEKLTCSNDILNDITTRRYHDFKRENGYSELEITQKAEALKDILIPLTLDEYSALIRDAGFKSVEVLSKYHHFTTMAAVK